MFGGYYRYIRAPLFWKLISPIPMTIRDKIAYILKNKDKRNYKVASNNFKKYFKNFKFTNFTKEINVLRKKMDLFKVRQNTETVRML